MLQPAMIHKENIEHQVSTFNLFDDYKYYHYGYFSKPSVEDDEWNSIQRVSISNECLLGYFTARLSRLSNYVDSISIISFIKNVRFSKVLVNDLLVFIDDLFTRYNRDYLLYSVIIGNPAQKRYEDFFRSCNGILSYTLPNKQSLNDNTLYDEKVFLINKQGYLNSRYHSLVTKIRDMSL